EVRMRRAMLAFFALAFLWQSARAAPPPDANAVTPPRLSLVDGTVSFWRPGAGDWAPARVNLPLAGGDALYTTGTANLELQVGPRAFVRANGSTMLEVSNLEPDFLALKLSTGQASLDVRELAPGHTLEIDTPSAAFTIEHPGYYRVDAANDSTTFITRRGGRATVMPADGHATAASPNEELVVSASGPAATFTAPDLDGWDRWNYDRSDHLLDAM